MKPFPFLQSSALSRLTQRPHTSFILSSFMSSVLMISSILRYMIHEVTAEPSSLHITCRQGFHGCFSPSEMFTFPN